MGKLTCSQTRFLNDVKEHKLTLVYDNEINRHLHFSKAHCSSYYFDIITWNNHLCITGDCGTYVFSRIKDMFEFFRMDKKDFNFRKNKKLNINPDYWAEKCISQSIYGQGIEKFSYQLFKKQVQESFKNIANYREFSREVRKEIWLEIQEQLLGDETMSKELCFYNVYNYSYKITGQKQFYFADFFEGNFDVYTFHFIWNLYAIVYGIKKYDELKAKHEAVPKFIQS